MRYLSLLFTHQSKLPRFFLRHGNVICPHAMRDAHLPREAALPHLRFIASPTLHS
jgi:hypothetical protein